MYTYFGHINWLWVIDEAVSDIARECNGSITRVQRKTGLPSYQIRPSVKVYSLFKVEVQHPEEICGVWATSPALEFLDAKDRLFVNLLEMNAADCMPNTSLIAWDVQTVDALGNLPRFPALLKAPLGSGGDSLYYVHDPEDILTICRSHREKALTDPSFIVNLQLQYGCIPSWSLQEIFPTFVLGNDRKCQLRAYVVFCEGDIYLYSGYEVRQPLWEKSDQVDSKAPSPMLAFDLDCCKGSAAVPYNYGRSKVHTDRLMLEEVSELSNPAVRESITAVMVKAFQALLPAIRSHMLKSQDRCIASEKGFRLREVGVAGVDLLVDPSHVVRIVELNNNPAMPQPHKNMTEKYRAHLKAFVGSVVALGLLPDLTSSASSELGFIRIN
jgi:hypothetical protein